MNTTGQKIANKAMSYKDKRGGFVWDYWSGLPRGASWCVGFVLYVLYQCGLKNEIYKPSKTSNPFWLPTIEEWLHEHATHVKMADAQPGDIVIFTWTGGGNNARKKGKCSRDHIGFIREKGNSKTCYTIEGNTSGGKVDTKTRALTNIFAIYRLDCCKSGQTVKKAKKVAEKAEKRAAGKRKALDISAWQGELSVANFRDIKSAGYDTVILRSSYTSQGSFTLHEDKVLKHNIKNALEAGLKVGIYHYSQAISSPESKKEAKFTLDTISPWKAKVTEPVAFDWEFGGRLNSKKAKSLGKKACTSICEAFCTDIKRAGYDTMVYANYSTLTGYLDDASLKQKIKIWIAHYAKSTPYKGYYLWQYTSQGSVPGIHGNVDVNVYAESAPTPTPTPTKKGYPGPWPTATVSKSTYTHKNALRWQKFINWYFDSKVLDEDGIFGKETKKYTVKFQKKVFNTESEWDGIVGSKTLKKAKEVRK